MRGSVQELHRKIKNFATASRHFQTMTWNCNELWKLASLRRPWLRADWQPRINCITRVLMLCLLTQLLQLQLIKNSSWPWSFQRQRQSRQPKASACCISRPLRRTWSVCYRNQPTLHPQDLTSSHPTPTTLAKGQAQRNLTRMPQMQN